MISEIFQYVDSFLLGDPLIAYAMIIVFMTIESSFIPFPSEVVVPPAAYYASIEGGQMNLAMVVVCATVGAILGALVNYYLAVWLGRPIVYKFANSRLGYICLIDESSVVRAEKYFDKHGAISTFIGRLIPAVRQLISIPAGLARMHLGKFVLFTTLGAGIWNCILAALGWWLSTFIKHDELFAEIEHYNEYLTWAGYGLGVIVVVFIAYNLLKKKGKSKC